MSQKRNPELEEKLPFYALGTLTSEEMAEIEAYAADFPDIAEELVILQETADQLPYSVPEMAPPLSVKTAVMAHARANPQPPIVAPQPIEPGLWERLVGWWKRPSGQMTVLRVAFAAVAIALFVSVSQQRSLRNQVAELDAENQTLAVENQTLAAENETLAAEYETLAVENQTLAVENETLLAELNAQEALILFASDVSAQRVPVPGTAAAPDANGGLFYLPESEELLLALSNLAPLTNEQIYQLWLIDEQPESAGLVQISADGTGVFRVESPVDLTAVNAVGLSIEPAGGSLQPTGDIVLFSEIDG